MRDYSFAASAYLLEPCHLRVSQCGEYGLGRAVLPAQLAQPLWSLAQRLGAKPFLEYAHGYALMNFTRKNGAPPCGEMQPEKCHDWEDLRLIRQFEGGQSERGFVAIHIAMVSHTAQLVRGIRGALRRGSDATSHLVRLLQAMRRINATMEGMWGASKPADYAAFRTFIMGIKEQPMFPQGVIYAGVAANTPMHWRGESGANDSIIPTMDNFLELTALMPHNPLTEILLDFRQYRPAAHSRWLNFVAEGATGMRSWLLENHPQMLLQLLEQVREFRWRHWQFTRRYILAHTKHPVATGGSPILSWLPNQLRTVLLVMQQVLAKVPDPTLQALVEEQLSQLDN